MNFRYGIEHEVAFINQKQQFADFSNTPFRAFEKIVAELPVYESDYPQLRVGDAGIKYKRWYIEGYERFNDDKEVIDCTPKGIEIRTTIHTSIMGAVRELNGSFELLGHRAKQHGFTAGLISFNPFFDHFEPNPPLTEFEISRRNTSPEKITADIPMMTYGPDLSLSAKGLSAEDVIDAARKLTYYSPFIIPFSFSSPFYQGELWKGLSIRTYRRTGVRPAAMAFIDNESLLFKSSPSLSQKARVPAENGRIEFKAFDSCADFQLYASLLALLKGIILDTTLTERATVPDVQAHQLSALQGFDDHTLYERAKIVLHAADRALVNEADRVLLKPLFSMLQARTTPAHGMKNRFLNGMPINDILWKMYELPAYELPNEVERKQESVA